MQISADKQEIILLILLLILFNMNFKEQTCEFKDSKINYPVCPPLYSFYDPLVWGYSYFLPEEHPYYFYGRTATSFENNFQNFLSLEPILNQFTKSEFIASGISPPSNEILSRNSLEEKKKLLKFEKTTHLQQSSKVDEVFVKIEFDLDPNQQKTQISDYHAVLENMFIHYNKNQQLYEEIIYENTKINPELKQLVKVVDQKLRTFKKTKEEMIKIVIRRTQRLYKLMNRCKKDNRFVKYGGFKSMNTVYLMKIFADPLFSRAFEEVIVTFREDFDEENNKKMNAIFNYITEIGQIQIEKIVKLLTEKNKMPWPLYWRQKMSKVILELVETYTAKKEAIIFKLQNEINN